MLEIICAACQKEFGIAHNSNQSHSICRRHYVNQLKEFLSPAQIEENLNKNKERKFCDDLSEKSIDTGEVSCSVET